MEPPEPVTPPTRSNSKPRLDPNDKPFLGRTLAVFSDFDTAAQLYLYQKTRELKEAIKAGEDLNCFRLQRPEVTCYIIFMEDSTRTRESFRNAALFHGMKVNIFDAKTSSFQKNETVTDTVKMLVGYSTAQTVFVIRSKTEGVCRWLGETMSTFTEERGYPTASFINGGDGRHEHPSHELNDEFSFLECQGWDRTAIHIVLVGDLFHARTVHSKAQGLQIYSEVKVDLVAPGELALPKHVEDVMRDAGFVLRKFPSIKEYLDQDKIARLWYFSQLQSDRFGEKMLERVAELRGAVTMKEEFVPRLQKDTKLFQSLPRCAKHPEVPFWLDKTSLNGWDEQSQNGYFTKIVLLGMLTGLLGDDFVRDPLSPPAARQSAAPPALADSLSRRSSSDALSALLASTDFVQEMPHEDSDTQVLASIHKGVIIKNLAPGLTIERIWGVMHMVRWVLKLDIIGSQGVHTSPTGNLTSGYIAVPNFDVDCWDRGSLKKLAATSPGAQLTIIRDGIIEKEFQLQVPPRIYNFQEISCKNEACISFPGNKQREVPSYFRRSDRRDWTLTDDASSLPFLCKYCDTRYEFSQIWDYKHVEQSGNFR